MKVVFVILISLQILFVSFVSCANLIIRIPQEFNFSKTVCLTVKKKDYCCHQAYYLDNIIGALYNITVPCNQLLVFNFKPISNSKCPISEGDVGPFCPRVRRKVNETCSSGEREIPVKCGQCQCNSKLKPIPISLASDKENSSLYHLYFLFILIPVILCVVLLVMRRLSKAASQKAILSATLIEEAQTIPGTDRLWSTEEEEEEAEAELGNLPAVLS